MDLIFEVDINGNDGRNTSTVDSINVHNVFS
jgi:hypothetical protein